MTLHDFFTKNRSAVLAFSGGVDSSYLLYAAEQEGADLCPYYVKSAFQPAFELEDAKRLAKQLSVPLRILTVDVLADPNVTANQMDRCYHCKKLIFSAISAAAERDGYCLILDGTNASDDAGDRPGMKALAELSVRSPLRECGLTKAEVRRLSKEAGLFTWDKPAYACLATRVPAGMPITLEALARTELAEDWLTQLGFRDFRVRIYGGAARIQIPEGQLGLMLKKREQVLEKLKKLYDAVMLDLETRG